MNYFTNGTTTMTSELHPGIMARKGWKQISEAEYKQLRSKSKTRNQKRGK